MQYKKFIEKSFNIIDKSGNKVPFILNKVQNKLLKNWTGKDIILKARQEGMSSLILAIFLVDFLTKENSRSVVISHESGATTKLFDRTKYFLKSLEDKGVEVNLKYNSRFEMTNKDNNSTFYVATAGSKGLLRGETINSIHFSEAAFFPETDIQNVILGAMQSVIPTGRIIFESTANGVGGYFHKEWQRAVRKESNFKAHFFSWKDFYSKDFIDQKRLDFADENLFKQEYPSTPEEAFISSGSPFFNLEVLAWYEDSYCKKPTKQGYLLPGSPPIFNENPQGLWKLWEEPKPNEQYLISADVGEVSDYSAVGILKRRTMELVGTLHGRLDASELALNLSLAGTWYNNALVAPEKNGLGLGCLTALKSLSYPNIYQRRSVDKVANKTQQDQGWLTTSATRPLMLADLQASISSKDFKIYDIDCVKEMMVFIRDPKTGKPQATPGNYDDLVIMLAILARLIQEVPVFNVTNYNSVVQENQTNIKKYRIGS